MERHAIDLCARACGLTASALLSLASCKAVAPHAAAPATATELHRSLDALEERLGQASATVEESASASHSLAYKTADLGKAIDALGDVPPENPPVIQVDSPDCVCPGPARCSCICPPAGNDEAITRELGLIRKALKTSGARWWLGLGPFLGALLVAVTWVVTLRLHQYTKTPDVLLEYQRRYEQVVELMANVGWTSSAVDYYEKFWRLQHFQFSLWRLGFIPNSTFSFWMTRRRSEWLEDAVLAATSYRDGWNSICSIYEGTDFKPFMKAVFEGSPQEAVRRYASPWYRKIFPS